MRVAIVHYHLRTGGVSRVIEHAVSLLHLAGHRVVVLASGDCPDSMAGEVVQVDELAYDEGAVPTDPQRLECALETAASGALGGPPDLWHIHNHHLGKNLALPAVVASLAEKGRALLLQIHDFPEDGRAYNYGRLRSCLPPEQFGRCLYPDAPHVHYAVLTGRDRTFLAGAGLTEDRLHWLPNPVWLQPSQEEPPDWPGKLWLYPTRAIRRKNLGEFVLWAALAGPEDHFATSLAPENPREQPVYQHWVSLAHELDLPLTFDLAHRTRLSFPLLLQSAHCLVTTSVAEGFGMAFLEPWLLERPVSGRDLPEITADFTAVGVDLSVLYSRLDIPVSWIGADVLRARLETGLDCLYRSYDLPLPDGETHERAWRAWVQEGRVDFGRLDEDLQTQVIRQLVRSATARAEFTPTLPMPSQTIVNHNRDTVAEVFDASRYQSRLMAIYQTVLEAEPGSVGRLDEAHLLECFLQPERLFLLRV